MAGDGDGPRDEAPERPDAPDHRPDSDAPDQEHRPEDARDRHPDGSGRSSTDGPEGPHPAGDAAVADTQPPRPLAPATYGIVGKPLNRHSPFYIGFFGATGALLAIGLWALVGRLSTTLTLIVVALFLTLALAPIVEALLSRGLRRPLAVAVVFAGTLVLFGIILAVVIPPVVEQGSQLARDAPTYAQDVLDSDWVLEMDRSYHVIDRVREELLARISDESVIQGVLGGIVGAGRAVINGVFQVFTVLVLTLYFLASLPRIKHAAYAAVPASRRNRVESLSEEMMRRVGSYAIGQAGIATLNALLSYVFMLVVGIPYAAVLAVTVGLLGLIPMIGATLGAVIVTLVALFDDPRNALFAVIYYVIYQQVENYVVAPRVMQRTVAVPGPVTIVAALAGAAVLGVLGALLAIPVAAGLLLLYEEVLVPRQKAS